MQDKGDQTKTNWDRFPQSNRSGTSPPDLHQNAITDCVVNDNRTPGALPRSRLSLLEAAPASPGGQRCLELGMETGHTKVTKPCETVGCIMRY